MCSLIVRIILSNHRYCYVIELGRITHHGQARDLLADPQVRQAFLGAR